MDGRFFDELAKGLDDGTVSRGRALKLVGAALFGWAFGLFAFPDAAHARNKSLLADAHCKGPAGPGIGSDGNTRFAQTFTAKHSLPLVRAKIAVRKEQGTTGDFEVSINSVASGVPTNTELASTTIPDSSVPVGKSTLTADFANPTQIVAGEEYALVVGRPGTSFYAVGDRTNNPCSGSLFNSTVQGGYIDEGNNDLVFSTFVQR